VHRNYRGSIMHSKRLCHSILQVRNTLNNDAGNCVRHIVFCWLNAFGDDVASGFLHRIESKPLSHDADTVQFGSRNYIVKATKSIPHLGVCRNPGRDEVDMTRRLYFEEEDGFFVQHNDVREQQSQQKVRRVLEKLPEGTLLRDSIVDRRSERGGSDVPFRSWNSDRRSPTSLTSDRDRISVSLKF
jgi:hypothetical protein